jgi:hypothetical protein
LLPSEISCGPETQLVFPARCLVCAEFVAVSAQQVTTAVEYSPTCLDTTSCADAFFDFGASVGQRTFAGRSSTSLPVPAKKRQKNLFLGVRFWFRKAIG